MSNVGTHTRYRVITGKENDGGCYNDSLIHASNHEHGVHKGMKLTMKKDTMAESTILLWFQSAYVLRIKKPAYIQLGTCICWGKGELHSEQIADIRLKPVRRKVNSVRTCTIQRTLGNIVHHMTFLVMRIGKRQSTARSHTSGVSSTKFTKHDM
jgi:hypothetical protein